MWWHNRPILKLNFLLARLNLEILTQSSFCVLNLILTEGQNWTMVITWLSWTSWLYNSIISIIIRRTYCTCACTVKLAEHNTKHNKRVLPAMLAQHNREKDEPMSTAMAWKGAKKKDDDLFSILPWSKGRGRNWGRLSGGLQAVFPPHLLQHPPALRPMQRKGVQ